MNFEIPGQTKELLARIRSIMEREVYPLEGEFANQGGKSFTKMLPRFQETRASIKAQGLWAPQVPTELGGMGLAFCDHALVSEELGRSPLGHYLFGAQAPDAGNLEILHKWGTPEQKERWLLPLAAG